MKKSLLSHLLVLAILIVFVSACSKKAEYTNVIPADASVVAINVKTLAEKAGVKDKENKEVLTKLTDALKSGMKADTYQQLEAIMKDPSKSGVDINVPIYIFTSPSLNTTVAGVLKVTNEKDLHIFLKAMEKEQVCTAIEKADNYSFVKIDNQTLIAFTPSTLLIVSYNNNSQLEKVKKDISTLLKQTETSSISSKPTFLKMQKQSGDINFLVSFSSIFGEYFKQINYAMPKDIDLKGLTIIGNLSFEKGKISLDAENYTENVELKTILEKQAKSTLPIENTFLKYFPKSTLALVSMGINGEEFYKLLQENETFRNNFSISKAAEVKDLFSIFQKDITIGLVNITMSNNAPTFLAYASVNNDSSLQALYEKKDELKLGNKEDIVKLGENEYVYKSRSINIFFGIHDKQLYATNDELLYKNICKPIDPSAKDTGYASVIKGKHSAFIVNVEAILALPIVKMLTSYGGKEYAIYYALADKISYLDITGKNMKSNLTLQLKDKEVNALKQIVDFIKEFAGM